MSLRQLRLLAAGMAGAMALLATGAVQALAIDESQLLPVDQAFALQASAPRPDRIELSWKIADGYYLYRHRTSVEVQGGGFVATELQLPDGERHTDEFFGEVETYRGSLLAVLPGSASPGTRQVVVKVKYQGCADLGVCYPPQTRTLTVALPSAAPGIGLPGAGTSVGGGLQLPGLAPNGLSDPLPEARAFGFEAIVGDPGTLLLRFTPAPGYYLYRDRSTFRIEGADGIVAGQPRWPAGSQHHDEYFGDVVVYFDQIDVPLPLQRAAGPATDLRLVATFQGCQTGGICYPPMTRTIELTVGAAEAAIEVPGIA
ncbi:MAG: cytochrome C biogenesis protein, partial [Pseudomonadota bacterium]|nr:cytochrome C biogenesis protein [Pseudomonadota bacterium]